MDELICYGTGAIVQGGYESWVNIKLKIIFWTACLEAQKSFFRNLVWINSSFDFWSFERCRNTETKRWVKLYKSQDKLLYVYRNTKITKPKQPTFHYHFRLMHLHYDHHHHQLQNNHHYLDQYHQYDHYHQDLQTSFSFPSLYLDFFFSIHSCLFSFLLSSPPLCFLPLWSTTMNTHHQRKYVNIS